MSLNAWYNCLVYILVTNLIEMSSDKCIFLCEYTSTSSVFKIVALLMHTFVEHITHLGEMNVFITGSYKHVFFTLKILT